MNHRFTKAIMLLAAIGLVAMANIGCGGGDECQATADCASKGADYVCQTADGKKVCKKKEDTGCKADSDCSGATPKCNTTSGKCEADPNVCSPACAADEECKSGKCEKKVDPNKCDPACAADEECKAGKCEKKVDPNKCDPACAADEECKAGKCEKKQTGCTKDTDCATGETCEVATGQCKPGSTGCTSDADCSDPTPKCNTGTGKCEAAPAGTQEPGQECSQTQPCVDGSVCITIQSDNKAYCFQQCTAAADCGSNAFRKTCTPFAQTSDGQTISVCLGEAAKGEACGYASDSKKQGLCKRGETPPIYCDTATQKCEEATVQKNEGDDCSKDGETTALKICDSDSGLACDQATAKCIKADIKKEGELCDPSGAGGSKPSLCDPSDKTMICLTYDSTNGLNRCTKRCDETKSGECTHTAGLTCEALLNGNAGEKGICVDSTCTADTDCVFPDSRCVSLQSGSKLCFPAVPSGPVPFAGVCKTPAAQFGCDTKTDPLASCLRLADQNGNQAPSGFCTIDCTQSKTCPKYKNSNGSEVTAVCQPIDQAGTAFRCLLPCGNQAGGGDCPTGLSCTQLAANQSYCFPPTTP